MQRPMLKKIKLIATFYLVASLTACGTGQIPKPVGKVGVVHAEDSSEAYIHEFDLETDFDDELHVIPGHNGMKKPLAGVIDLDKHVCMNASSYANTLSTYAKLKRRYEECVNGQK